MRVYPGSYKVSIGKSGYVTSGITMVRTNAVKSDLFFSIMYSPVAAVRPFSPLSLFSLTPSR